MELLNDDCISSIFSFISDSFTYNSICLSSSFLYKLVKEVHPNTDRYFSNHFYKLGRICCVMIQMSLDGYVYISYEMSSKIIY